MVIGFGVVEIGGGFLLMQDDMSSVSSHPPLTSVGTWDSAYEVGKAPADQLR